MKDKERAPTKAEEVAQSIMVPEREAVPAYGDHLADDLYTDFNPTYGTGLPAIDDPPEDILGQPPENYDREPFLEPPYEPPLRVASPVPPPTHVGPLSLTLDKALIFPNTIPATALYSLNYTLNTMGSSITLRRSVPGHMRASGTQGKIIDKDLYDITRPPFDLLSFSIHGKRKSTYPGVGDIRMKSGFATKYWECKFKDKVVLKCKAGEWSDGEGKLVATEVNEVIPKKGKGKGKEVTLGDGVRENPGLNFERRENEHDLVVDLLVACWCAKMWYAETLDAKTVSDGECFWGSTIK